MAETKKAELEKSVGNPFMRQIRHAYNEIITWAQKFVTFGDIISQIDPVHIGLPWTGVRAVLIVRTAFFNTRVGLLILVAFEVAIHDQKSQAEVLDAVAHLSRLICRYAVFEEIYLQDQSLLQESLKIRLTAELKALYLAVFRYLVESVLYLSRSPRGQSFGASVTRLNS